MNIEQELELDGERMTTRTRTIEDEHYWRHLERQYAGQAMQAILSNPDTRTTPNLYSDRFWRGVSRRLGGDGSTGIPAGHPMFEKAKQQEINSSWDEHLGAISEASILYARALIARLKGETG